MSSTPPTARLADADAERLLLSALMKAPEMAFPEVLAAGVTAEDFTQHAHRLCFAALADLAGTGSGVVGPHSLFLVLKARRQLAEFGPHPARWVGDLWFDDPTGCWSSWAIHRLLAMSRRRLTVRKAREEIKEAMAGSR